MRPVRAEVTDTLLPPASRPVARTVFHAGGREERSRDVAEEVAVALSYGGSTQAVMMATPADLEDFAVGFSLTERIIETPSDLETIDVVPTADGIDIQMWLTTPRDGALARRRRTLAGPTGCGLCGVDSLAEAMRQPRQVGDQVRLDSAAIAAAIGSLGPDQALHKRTGAVHAAALWRPAAGLSDLREDVGRHNALDKLVGALARRGESGGGGVLLLTSRVSVEMVQKAAVLGAEIIVAVSAPTALAIRVAEAAGITLVAVARADGFEVFTHPRRIVRETGISAWTAGRSPDNQPSVFRRSGGREPLMSVDDALAAVLAGVAPIAGDDRVSLCDAVGRAIAETLTTPQPLPRFDHSAMDGYGISALDCGRTPPFSLRLVGTVLAGGSAACSVRPGETARMLTGAPIPQGVAAVVMEEHCGFGGETVAIRRAIAPGLNIRRRGEDAPESVVIAMAGSLLGLAQVPILAACGIHEVTVRRKLRVAILSTGDEISAAAAPLAPASVYDVNRSMLKVVLAQPWIEIVDAGVVRDDAHLLAEALARAVGSADLVIASGGVSGSDADHMSAAVDLAGGQSRILRIAIKPGKPLLVGAIGDAPVLGLPGNPLSALANVIMFGRALLNRRAGRPDLARLDQPAILSAPLVRRPGRAELMPATIIERRESGMPVVVLAPQKGSARLRPLATASGLAIIAAETETLAEGEWVAFAPFDDLWAERRCGGPTRVSS